MSSVKSGKKASPAASAPVTTPAPTPAPASKAVKGKASPTPAEPVVAAPAPAPVETASKKKGGKVEAAPVVAPVASVTPDEVVNTAEPVVEADSVSSLLALLQKQNHDIMTTLRTQNTLLTAFFKTVQRERKRLATQKGARRVRKVKEGTHKPSGFAVPATISDGLCEFLGVTKGTQLSRTDVTRRICAYIKEKKLQNADNKRQFHPDTALGKVLGPLQDKDVSGGYTYFNLQYYINAHFPKSASASATTSA